MTTYPRANAWNGGGTLESNADLLLYAKAVGVMQSRPLNDPASWWFFAAIHGSPAGAGSTAPWAGVAGLPPQAVAPEPSAADARTYFNQCQHQSWYFLPWHRGFVHALEAQLRAIIVGQLDGPPTWAMPYWDPFGPDRQYHIPPAFLQPNLPREGGLPAALNPLHITARYGHDPDDIRNIYVSIDRLPDGYVHQTCLGNTSFVTSANGPGFGGRRTAFNHGGGDMGAVEINPHMNIHTDVGGSDPHSISPGWMSMTELAALDPIFPLHHCNIDRMWAAWNSVLTNTNPSEPTWLNGPAGGGFVMPKPNGTPWRFTPADVSTTTQLDYSYDSLPALPAAGNMALDRLIRLGVPGDIAISFTEQRHRPHRRPRRELAGAHDGPVEIRGPGVTLPLRLQDAMRRRIERSLVTASQHGTPDRIFLELEHVRGNFDAVMLQIAVGLPHGACLAEHRACLADTVSLFGLSVASRRDRPHAGQGLRFRVEITSIIDHLHQLGLFQHNQLVVDLLPTRPLPDGVAITVGHIALYRLGL